MARSKLKSGLPDAIRRREILAGNSKYAKELDGLGKSYLEHGRLADAIDAFERARDFAGLEEVKRLAIECDVFLLTRLAKIEGVAVGPDAWRRAGEGALASGRDRSAALAFARAGDEARAAAAKEKVAALRAELKPPTRGRGGLEIG